MFEKEALELEAEEKAKKRTKGFACQENCEKSYVMGALDFAEPREKRIEELEEKISVLLSCKDCPENKDGLICQKEYENKCLAQKIQFIKELQQENAELKSIAEFQQSSNMTTHFENKKLKEGLAVGSTWNKALNSRNKYLEEERDKFRNMVFDKMEQFSKAKEIIKNLLDVAKFYNHYRDKGAVIDIKPIYDAEQFLKEVSE